MYTGGKFIQNCLSISNDVLPPMLILCELEYLIKNKDVNLLWKKQYEEKLLTYCNDKWYNVVAGSDWPDIKDYADNNFVMTEEIAHDKSFYYLASVDRLLKFRHCDNLDTFTEQVVMQTLPNKNDRENWNFYEYSSSIIHDSPIEFDWQLAKFNNSAFTCAIHQPKIYHHIKTKCKDYKAIAFTNFKKFQDHAVQLKCAPGDERIFKVLNSKIEKYQVEHNLDNCYQFDVDKYLYSFNEQLLLEEVLNIYNYCQLETPTGNRLSILKKYIHQYIDLHI